jgi:ribosomal-protein-alanine N-acetyltransferase
MRFHFAPLRWRDARQIRRWRYTEPYSVYDLNTPDMLVALYLSPLWRLAGVARFCAVRDEHGTLVGMFQFMRHGAAMEIGVALRPDLTGQGLGLDLVRAGLLYGVRHFQPVIFKLEVAAFNERARRVYERAGFRAVRSLPKRVGSRTLAVLEMVCPAVDVPLTAVGAPVAAHENADPR